MQNHLIFVADSVTLASVGGQVQLFLTSLSVIVILLAAFIALFFRLASRLDSKAVSPAWLDDFSLDSYAPMERLLDGSDFDFLAAQPGYRPEIGKRLLAERRDIFREYLSLLIRDFNQLHFFAKLILVNAPQDRSEFARDLFHQQFRFYCAVCVVRCKLAVYPLGWTPLDVPKLLHALERLRSEVQASMSSQASEPAAI